MGPKKVEGMTKKTEKKVQEKIIEDKTFGLKNKNKSKTVQNYIKGVENTVKTGNKSMQGQLNKEFEDRAEKKKQREEEAFLASLSKSVKTIQQHDCEDDFEKRNLLCEFFSKQGFCEDGDKCMFSHDVNIQYNVSLFLKSNNSKVLSTFTLISERLRLN